MGFVYTVFSDVTFLTDTSRNGVPPSSFYLGDFVHMRKKKVAFKRVFI